MSTFLHMEDVRWVAAGGALPASGENLIAGENAEVMVEKVIAEHILAKNPNPSERIVVGRKISLKATLAAATLEDLADLCGGTYTAVPEAYTEGQGIGGLSEFDIQGKIKLTDGSYNDVDVTNMHFIGNLNIAMANNHDGRWYLNVEAASTETSTLTVAPAT